jgi:PIN domain nuclease of toxin-antitoxin system
MRILLDTHVWLWMVTAPGRLAAGAREELASVDNELLLSAASVWEMAIKYQLGKLPLPEPPETFVPPRLLRDDVRPLPVDLRHAAHVAQLPPHHRDPFDRLLIAQARLEGLVLCSVDGAFADYDVKRLAA